LSLDAVEDCSMHVHGSSTTVFVVVINKMKVTCLSDSEVCSVARAMSSLAHCRAPPYTNSLLSRIISLHIKHPHNYLKPTTDARETRTK